jgi:hypothetical protein
MGVVDVDPQALIAAHRATDPRMAEYERVAGIRDYVKGGGTLAMPEIGVSGNRLGFINGRNRAKYAEEMGLTTIPVAIERSDAERMNTILSRFGDGDNALLSEIIRGER